MRLTPRERRFHLERAEDVTGTSGTGRVAEGVVFSDGITVLHWLSACQSTNIYGSVEAVLQVHGHAGATRLIWDDPDPAEVRS